MEGRAEEVRQILQNKLQTLPVVKDFKLLPKQRLGELQKQLQSPDPIVHAVATQFEDDVCEIWRYSAYRRAILTLSGRARVVPASETPISPSICTGLATQTRPLLQRADILCTATWSNHTRGTVAVDSSLGSSPEKFDRSRTAGILLRVRILTIFGHEN